MQRKKYQLTETRSMQCSYVVEFTFLGANKTFGTTQLEEKITWETSTITVGVVPLSSTN